MRTNLEDVRSFRMRHFATKRPTIEYNLTGVTFDIPTNGPELYMFDAGGGNKNVRLPVLSEEFSVLIANIGVANSISVFDSLNVLQTSLIVGDVKYFFSGKTRWVWLPGNFLVSSSDLTGFSEELRQVTAAGAQVISATETGIVVNKAVASPTPVTVPLSSTRFGRPIRFADWRGNVDIANPLTITPTGAEKIQNLASWEASSLSGGGLILFPHATLGGYTVGA